MLNDILYSTRLDALTFEEKRLLTLNYLQNDLITEVINLGYLNNKHNIYSLSNKDLAKLINKNPEGEKYLNRLNKKLIVILELIQDKEIYVNTFGDKNVKDLEENRIYYTNRLSNTPLYTFDIDGNITKIEIVHSAPYLNLTLGLIDLYETRLPRIKNDVKRLKRGVK